MKIKQILWIFNIYFKKISLITISIMIFYEVFSGVALIKFINVFVPLFASKYVRYDDSMFLSCFYMYLLFA